MDTVVLCSFDSLQLRKTMAEFTTACKNTNLSVSLKYLYDLVGGQSTFHESVVCGGFSFVVTLHDFGRFPELFVVQAKDYWVFIMLSRFSCG